MEQGPEGTAPALQAGCGPRPEPQSQTRCVVRLSENRQEEAQARMGRGYEGLFSGQQAHCQHVIGRCRYMTPEEQKGMSPLALIFVIFDSQGGKTEGGGW